VFDFLAFPQAPILALLYAYKHASTSRTYPRHGQWPLCVLRVHGREIHLVHSMDKERAPVGADIESGTATLSHGYSASPKERDEILPRGRSRSANPYSEPWFANMTLVGILRDSYTPFWVETGKSFP